MKTTFWIAAAWTIVCLVGVLIAERRGNERLKQVMKPLASGGFLAAALLAGALRTSYGFAILVGLFFSYFGDFFLMWRDRTRFVAGIASFLLGHVAYAVAFLLLGVAAGWSWVALAVATPIAAGVLRWLWPHVEAKMRGPVVAYVVVITAMVVLAVGTQGAGARVTVLIGAIGFYLSDLSVARDRFVSRSFWNRLWGLPLYYVAQLVLASTVAG